MAKEKKQSVNETKQTMRAASRWRFADMLAFAGLALAAFLIVLGPFLRWILNKTDNGKVFEIINMVAQYSLLAAIAIPAWIFVRRKRFGWKVFYLIILVVYIVGTVLGVTLF